jgi:hypothetical protein
MPDLELSDPLKQLRKELIEEATKRDRRVADTLSQKTEALDKRLLAYHTDVMTALAQLTKTTEAHAAWMLANDQAKLVADREKAEQQQKEVWAAELVNQEAAARKARHDRWAPYLPIGFGSLVALAGGSVLYLLENLNTLKWDFQTQIVTVVLASIGVISWLLLKYGP